MLCKLTIKNIALIDSVTIDFSEGLNVLSGETGSGKSVIIDSLNFVLGAKADKSMIRYGENECSVTAVFSLSEKSSAVRAALDEYGIECDDELIIRRRYNESGKGEIRLNGEPITANMLRSVTSRLVDLHGQSDHYLLLKESAQLDVVDKYGAAEVLDKKEQFVPAYREYRDVLKRIKELGGNASERAIRLDILNYQIKEIEKAELYEGEEEELLTLKNKAASMEKITEALGSAHSLLTGDNGSVDSVSSAAYNMSLITKFDDEYASLCERLESARTELDDIAETINDALGKLDFDANVLEDTENRLDLIRGLKKKYGGSISEIMSFLDKSIEERKRLNSYDELYASLIEDEKCTGEKLLATSKALSAARKAAASALSSGVTRELKELGMSKGSFEVNFSASPEDISEISSNGYDTVEFMFSANLGEPLKPLSKIISGGEMSRFMLAIKTETAGLSEVSTFVFDEIDAGISGKTARIVAEKFASISLGTQIIAITHLPQISSMSDTGLMIAKAERDGKTLTSVTALNKEQKIDEISRLMGGDQSPTARCAAEELIASCEQYKSKLNK